MDNLNDNIVRCILCLGNNPKIKNYSFYIALDCFEITICKNCYHKFVKLVYLNAPYLKKSKEGLFTSYGETSARFNFKGISENKKMLKSVLRALKKEPHINQINALNWSRYVKKEFPELYDKESHKTFYLFLFDFLPAVEDAHRKSDKIFLKKAYKFAEKCYHSKSYYISNAISVTFYEHISDHPLIMQEMNLFIKKHIIEEVVIPLTRYIRPKNYNKLVRLARKMYPNLKIYGMDK